MALTSRVHRIDVADPDPALDPVRCDVHVTVQESDPKTARVFPPRGDVLRGEVPRSELVKFLAAVKVDAGSFPKSDVPLPVPEKP